MRTVLKRLGGGGWCNNPVCVTIKPCTTKTVVLERARRDLGHALVLGAGVLLAHRLLLRVRIGQRGVDVGHARAQERLAITGGALQLRGLPVMMIVDNRQKKRSETSKSLCNMQTIKRSA